MIGYDSSSGYTPQADQYNGLLKICIDGEIVKGTGLPEAVCDFVGVTDLDYLNQTIVDATSDDSVQQVLLDFNSPGGSPHSHTTALLVQELAQKKPVIGYSDGMVLSAAYNIAAMCDELYVSETAKSGFIGSIYARLDATAANKQAGLKYSFFASSPKKLYYNPDAPITKEEANYIQETVLYYYNIFKSDVLSNRKIAEEYLDATMFSGVQGVAPNIVDGVINSVQELEEQLLE